MRDNPVVSIALRYLGVPYLWGGARPRTGFDCSGLVQYVFGQLGVPLVHYAASQWHSPGGVWIPPDRLQAGDLVFFTGSDGTRHAPGHVGIYIRDGYFIDAPHTGSFVRVDSLDERTFADEYVGARSVASQPQLLARHLYHVTQRDRSAAATPSSSQPGQVNPPNPLGSRFPSPLTISPLRASGVTAAVAAPAKTASPHTWIWTGLASAALLLLLGAGLFVFATVRRLPSRPAIPRTSTTAAIRKPRHPRSAMPLAPREPALPLETPASGADAASARLGESATRSGAEGPSPAEAD